MNRIIQFPRIRLIYSHYISNSALLNATNACNFVRVAPKNYSILEMRENVLDTGIWVRNNEQQHGTVSQVLFISVKFKLAQIQEKKEKFGRQKMASIINKMPNSCRGKR